MARSKRLWTICSIVAYVTVIGLPYWWWSTSITRPAFDGQTRSYFAALASEQEAQSGGSQREGHLAAIVTLVVLRAARSDIEGVEAVLRAHAAIRDTVREVLFATLDADGCHVESHSFASDKEAQTWANAYSVATTMLTGQHGELGRPEDTCDADNVVCRFSAAADAAHTAAAGLIEQVPEGRYTIFAMDRAFVSQKLSHLTGTLPARGCSAIGRKRGAWVLLEGSSDKFSDPDLLRIGEVSSALTRMGQALGVRLPVSPASEITASFALVIEDAAELQGWDFAPWQQEVLDPLAERLQPLLSLRSESQVRLFAPARLPESEQQKPKAALGDPQHDTQEGQQDSGAEGATVQPHAAATLLEEAELPFFADLDGWSLGFGRSGSGHVHPLSPHPHLIPERLLHFVAYVPALRRQPVLVRGAPPSAGYVMPGWGAVGLVNTLQATPQLPRKHLAAYFGVFAHQFRELLGLDERRPHFELSEGAAAHLPPGKQIVADWEVDALMRERFEQMLQETAHAVVTLLDLVAVLPNLEIPLTIGAKVGEARAHTDAALAAAARGEYLQALRHARAGRTCADVAATHHTIVSQHSYPEQHKVALYLPLFAPLALPLLTAFTYEARRALGLLPRSGAGGA